MVTFTSKDGDVVKVDKSFGYRRAEDGSLKLVPSLLASLFSLTGP